MKKYLSITGAMFIFFGLIFLLILLFKTPIQGAEVVIKKGSRISARTVIQKAWAKQYPKCLEAEFALGKEHSGKKSRDVASWSDYSDNSALIFLGKAKIHYGSPTFASKKDTGTLFLLNRRKSFGYDLLVRKRGRIKKKGGYSAMANGTQLNYFDLRRSLLPENLNDFDFSFVASALDNNLALSSFKIKITPRKKTADDYAFRVVTIKKMRDGVSVVIQVDYYKKSNDKKPVKTQIRLDFRLHPVGTGNGTVWRPRQVEIKSADGKKTEIIFTNRKFNNSFGNLNKSALKNGGPKK